MLFDIKINDIMDKDPLYITIEENLASITSKMTKKNKEMAIVMENEKIKGILKFTDLCFVLKTYILSKINLDKIPSEIKLVQINELMQNPTLKDICEKCGFTKSIEPLYTRENSNVGEAIEVMALSGLDYLLVLGKEGILGIVSDHDIISAIGNIYKTVD